MKYFRKPLYLLLIISILAGMLSLQPPEPVWAESAENAVRISQVYGGGGDDGSLYQYDFIELYNASDSPVILDGWSVQYRGPTGTSWQKTDLEGTIPANSYYLIQGAKGSGGSLELPTPDKYSNLSMSAEDFKVALTNTTNLLYETCPTGSAIVDFVGVGDANCNEGNATAPEISSTTSALRKDKGRQDTDDNAADFVAGTPNPRNTAFTAVRISQAYGGGGNDGALYKYDFIELFNASDSEVNLNGWSVQYASASGNFNNITNLSGTIKANSYYLIQQAQGAGGTLDLPTPDATGNAAMSATNFKVVLANKTTAVSGDCLTDNSIVDFVGVGSANCKEGNATVPVLSNTTAALRKENGCQDTDQNGADFDTGAPTPRNTGSPTHSCSVAPTVFAERFIISEYTEGSSGQNKAIELYNGTGADIDLKDYELTLHANGGTNTTSTTKWTNSTIVPNGETYVIAHSQAHPDLFAKAQLTNTNMTFNGDDALILWHVTPEGNVVQDSFGQFGSDPGTGWGSGATQTWDRTLVRKAEICQGDTIPGDEFEPADEYIGYPDMTFTNFGSHTMTCGAPVDVPPSVSTTVPANNATNVGLASDIKITFSEPVSLSEGWYSISCTVSGDHTATVSDANPIFTLNPDLDFSANETCAVSIDADKVLDQDDPIEAMAVDYTFIFTTAEGCGGPTTGIYDIQGTGMATGLPDQTVVTVEGVVVGDYQVGGRNGFFIQEVVGDNNPATSDGIFIYAPGIAATDVNLGDKLRIRGSVSEYYNQTQITNNTWQLCSSGNKIEPTVITLPVENVNDFEKYEGMLVKFEQPLIVSEYFNFDRYGEIVLTTERFVTGTAKYEPGSDEYYDEIERFNLNKITLDDGRSLQNQDPAYHPNGAEFTLTNLFRGGGTVTNLVGVMDYYSKTYRLQPVFIGEYEETNPRTAAPELQEGDLTIASFNVLNYFVTLDGSGNRCGPAGNMECRGADNANEFTRQRAKILAAMNTIDADIFGLMEIENDRPGGQDPVADLVAGLNDLKGAGTYAYIHTGAFGTDAIKQAILYKPGSVSLVGEYKLLTEDIDPLFDTSKNRPSLAQAFIDNANDVEFVVSVNHLKSKGSACDGDPDLGDGAGNCNTARTEAAQALADWLVPENWDGIDKFLIIGDLNAYDKETPIDAIKAGADDEADTPDDFVDTILKHQGEDAYGYVYDGMVGYLDHALASPAMDEIVLDTNFWHINADEPDILDYDTSNKPNAQWETLYAENAYRSSDHDPVIVSLKTIPDNQAPVMEVVTPEAGLILLGPNDPFVFTMDASDTNLKSVHVGLSIHNAQFTLLANPDNPFATELDAAGAAALGITVSYDDIDQIWTMTFPSTVTQEYLVPDGITFTTVLEDDDGAFSEEGTYAYTFNLDDVAPVMEDVTPEPGLILLGPNDSFEITMDASDTNLKLVQIGLSVHNAQFTLLADSENPFATEADAEGAEALGITVTYDDEDQIWTMTFPSSVTQEYLVPEGITFTTVLEDFAGNVSTTGVYVYTFNLDDVAPTVTAAKAIGADGFADVYAAEMTIMVDEGYIVSKIEITMNEPVAVAVGTQVTINPQASVYGTVTAVNGAVITVTPAVGNETASVVGTFTFTVPTGSVKDLAGNAWLNVPITLVVRDTTAPTIVSGEAIDATGFSDVEMVGTTFTVPQGYIVDHIEFTMSEPVQIVAPGIVYFEGNLYGLMSASGNVVTITPNSGNEVAAIPGSFTFTIDAGSILDMSGNALETLTATMVVEESPIFNITDFGPWGTTWPGAYNLGWGYVPLFDTTTIAKIEVGMLDADRKSIVSYTAEDEQIVWQRANDYITDAKLSSAPFYRVYNGNPLAEGVGEDWTVVFGESFDAWSPRWGYVRVTDSYGTVVYREIEYTGTLGDLTAPEIDEAVAVGADPFDDVTADNLTFTVPQGYTVEKIEFTMNETVTVVADTVVTLEGEPYGSITADGTLITVTPYASNKVANRLGTFVFKVPGGKIFDISGNPLGTLSATMIVTNVAPVAVAETYTVAEDGVLTVGAPGVLGNDTDFDPTILTAVMGTNPTNGSLTLNADGSFTYTPDSNFNGTDSFTYQVSDGELLSDLAVVTITVTPVNDWVVALDDDAYETLANVSLVVDEVDGVLANDVLLDPDEEVSIQILDEPQHGTLSMSDDGSFTYVPDAGFMGVDTFRYIVVSVQTNQILGEWGDDATVTILVKPQSMIYLPMIFK